MPRVNSFDVRTARSTGVYTTANSVYGFSLRPWLIQFRHMARPYGDPVEIVTGPVPAQSPFIPLDAKIVVGAVAPASPDPIPIVLLPGFEYRMLEWRHPESHEVHWRLERRKSGRSGETDD
jgi:hypothetical protein